MSGWGRRLFVLLWAVALAGCSSVRPWVNAPLKPDRAAPQGLVQSDRDPSILVAVTLSGGGARAAAFGPPVDLPAWRKPIHLWSFACRF